MDSELKTRWVNALESGDYEQGFGFLNSDNGYCCLGVLCDLLAEDGVVSKEPKLDSSLNLTSYDDAITLPMVKTLDSIGLRYDTAETLASMNDGGKSFSDIASWIKRWL